MIWDEANMNKQDDSISTWSATRHKTNTYCSSLVDSQMFICRFSFSSFVQKFSLGDSKWRSVQMISVIEL